MHVVNIDVFPVDSFLQHLKKYIITNIIFFLFNWYSVQILWSHVRCFIFCNNWDNVTVTEFYWIYIFIYLYYSTLSRSLFTDPTSLFITITLTAAKYIVKKYHSLSEGMWRTWLAGSNCMVPRTTWVIVNNLENKNHCIALMLLLTKSSSLFHFLSSSIKSRVCLQKMHASYCYIFNVQSSWSRILWGEVEFWLSLNTLPCTNRRVQLRSECLN